MNTDSSEANEGNEEPQTAENGGNKTLPQRRRERREMQRWEERRRKRMLKVGLRVYSCPFVVPFRH